MESSGRRTLAVVVPVHNELANIGPFFERLAAALATLPGIESRIVFVNDGSDDGSYERIRELARSDDRVKIVTLSRQFGYHGVLMAGLSLASADLYAIVDVDGEDPPELFREFLAAIVSGADVAYGIRSNRPEPSPITFGRRLFYYVNKWIADSEIIVWMAEFAMITRQVRDAIIAPRTTYPFLRAEIGYVGFARVGIPYVRGARMSGKTHYSMWRMTRFAVSGFLASSTFPLRLILYLAALTAVLFPVAMAVVGGGPAGATTLAAITALYFILFSLPTIALYLARTYKNGVARPTFIVDRNKTSL